MQICRHYIWKSCFCKNILFIGYFCLYTVVKRSRWFHFYIWYKLIIFDHVQFVSNHGSLRNLMVNTICCCASHLQEWKPSCLSFSMTPLQHSTSSSLCGWPISTTLSAAIPTPASVTGLGTAQVCVAVCFKGAVLETHSFILRLNQNWLQVIHHA